MQNYNHSVAHAISKTKHLAETELDTRLDARFKQLPTIVKLNPDATLGEMLISSSANDLPPFEKHLATIHSDLDILKKKLDTLVTDAQAQGHLLLDTCDYIMGKATGLPSNLDPSVTQYAKAMRLARTSGVDVETINATVSAVRLNIETGAKRLNEQVEMIFKWQKCINLNYSRLSLAYLKAINVDRDELTPAKQKTLDTLTNTAQITFDVQDDNYKKMFYSKAVKRHTKTISLLRRVH